MAQLLPSDTGQFNDASGRLVTQLFYDVPSGNDPSLFLSNLKATLESLSQTAAGMPFDGKVIISTTLNTLDPADPYVEVDYVAFKDATLLEKQTFGWSNLFDSITNFMVASGTAVKNTGIAILQTAGDIGTKAVSVGDSILQYGPLIIGVVLLVFVVSFFWRR